MRNLKKRYLNFHSSLYTTPESLIKIYAQRALARWRARSNIYEQSLRPLLLSRAVIEKVPEAHPQELQSAYLLRTTVDKLLNNQA